MHKMKLSPDPYCICDGSSNETVEHILTECPRFLLKRYECECSIDLELTSTNIKIAVGDEQCREVFLAYAERVIRSAAKLNGSIM